MPGYRLPPVPANVRWSMSLLDRVAAKRKRTHSRAVAARLWTGFRSGKKKKKGKKKRRNAPPPAIIILIDTQTRPRADWSGWQSVPLTCMHSRVHSRDVEDMRLRRPSPVWQGVYVHIRTCVYTRTHVHVHTHSIPGERKTRAPTFGSGDRRRRIPRARAGGTRIAAGDTPSFREIPLRLGAST